MLPFEALLQRAVGLDVVAWALIHGPERVHPLARDAAADFAFSEDGWLPLLPGLVDAYAGGRDVLALWLNGGPEARDCGRRIRDAFTCSDGDMEPGRRANRRPRRLSEPWMELIGGFMPRDAQARADLAARLERESPELRAALADVRRMS